MESRMQQQTEVWFSKLFYPASNHVDAFQHNWGFDLHAKMSALWKPGADLTSDYF